MILKLLLILSLSLNHNFSSISGNGITVKLVESNSSAENIEAPQFDGGEEALSKYITDRLSYPLLLVDIEMEGDVRTKVHIGKDGAVKGIDILQGFDPLADDRVIDLIKKMPNWLPASKGGEPIEAAVELIISFTLNDSLRNYVREQKEKGVSLEELDKSLQTNIEEEKEEINKEEAKVVVEQKDSSLNRLPEFPGGKKALEAHLKENLKYPKAALDMNIEGRVVFNLTVSAEGEITNVVLHKGLYYECNEEAYYLIKRMPKWTPGLKGGKPTTMEVLLPIPFVLPK